MFSKVRLLQRRQKASLWGKGLNGVCRPNFSKYLSHFTATSLHLFTISHINTSFTHTLLVMLPSLGKVVMTFPPWRSRLRLTRWCRDKWTSSTGNLPRKMSRYNLNIVESEVKLYSNKLLTVSYINTVCAHSILLVLNNWWKTNPFFFVNRWIH